MKEYNKYLIIAVIIVIVALLFYYFSNLKEETFTYGEEQIITAQLLAANGGFIPKMAGAGNPDEVSQYKYMNSHGINVNALPLNVQQLTNPLCFNDVLHSHPYTSSKKGGAISKGSHGSGLKHDIFKKDETPAMKQLIKANDQLIDANEELLILAGKGEHGKKHQEKKKQEHDKMKKENGKYHKNGTNTSNAGNTAPLSLTISVNTPGTTSVPINLVGGTGISTTTSSPLTPVSTKQNGQTQRSSTPAYSSIYEEQVTGSSYTKCINRGYSSDYCNNMYGEQYGSPDTTPASTPVPATTTTAPVTPSPTPVVATTTATTPSPA